MSLILDNLFSEQIFEIRYSAIPQILDYRGQLARIFSAVMNLDHWRIDTNRVDIYNDLKVDTERVFISYKNAGGIYKCDHKQHPLPSNFFYDKTNKFITNLYNQKFITSEINIFRVGVRARYILPSTNDFKELSRIFTTKFCSLTPGAIKAFNAELIEIGCPIVFKTDAGILHTLVRPLTKNQILEQLPYLDIIEKYEIPEVAIYIDIDYWKEITKKITDKDLQKICRKYSLEIQTILTNLNNIFMDEKDDIK